VALTLTDASGGVVTFTPSVRFALVVSGLTDIYDRQFAAQNWTFPDGAKLTFSYVEQSFGDTQGGVSPVENRKVLTQVANNLGRSLSFQSQRVDTANSQGNSYGYAPAYRITGVTTDTGAHVSYDRDCSSAPIGVEYLLDCKTFEVVRPDGGRTIYRYEADANSPDPAELLRPNYRLRRIYTPSDTTNAYQTVTYDELMRVKSVKNIANETTQDLPGAVSTEIWKRGVSIDPLGNA
jgi:hypothetical protein